MHSDDEPDDVGRNRRVNEMRDERRSFAFIEYPTMRDKKTVTTSSNSSTTIFYIRKVNADKYISKSFYLPQKHSHIRNTCVPGYSGIYNPYEADVYCFTLNGQFHDIDSIYIHYFHFKRSIPKQNLQIVNHHQSVIFQ